MKNTFLSLVLVCSSLFAHADEPAPVDVTAQLQTLMQSLLPFAAENLAEFGEFYPFGGALTATLTTVPVVGQKEGEFIDQQAAANAVIAEFKKGISEQGFIATALFTDITIQAADPRQSTKAVAIYLEHQQGKAMVVHFPYRVLQGQLQWGKMIVNPSVAMVFAPSEQ